MSIICLLYGLDLPNISWSYITMCALHDGSGIFLLFVGILEILNMTFHHVYLHAMCFMCFGFYVTFHGNSIVYTYHD